MNSRPKPIFVICTGTVALALLMAFSAPLIGREPAPVPDVRIVETFTQVGSALPPASRRPPLWARKQPMPVPQQPRPQESILSLQNPVVAPNFDTKRSSRDKPTPEPSLPQTTVTITATESKMGDTRTVDGQQQVYFLGFGWIDDSNGPNIGIVVDDEGDINKMVGVI